ncbi:60S ribosome subunit biogenesis protein NIP7 [Sesamum alatum]|uniref:60S ribosome subunit biogenesis protein NIP7 n=1 Tax=Sesamum alatum TaxID=300844 RepID=A0AAE1XQV1_9LAMI|nr:60S ribosome subunit biogenesis protein NIP7 [Sesamum alatum]
MRPLDEKETTLVFNNLHKFVESNLKNIVLESRSHEGPNANPERYCFRLQKNRVYYVSESLIKRATNVKRDKLVSLGTQIGKFTKAGKFFLTIQSLNLLAANAKHKVWLKPTSEMSFFVREQCVERQNEQGWRRSPTGWYKCGRPGHWSCDCPSALKPNPSSSTDNNPPLPPNSEFNSDTRSRPPLAPQKPKQNAQRKTRPKLTPDLLLSNAGIGYILR